jgi:uncharacterized protein
MAPFVVSVAEAGPPGGPARGRILETAYRLFYARGLRAAGVDTIIAESKVSKATFYKYFRAKDELVFAYLEKFDGIWTGQLRDAAEAAGPDPAAQLAGMFDALGTACRRDDYRGCAFINAAAESAPGTPVHDRTVAHKNKILEWMRSLAAQAGAPQPDRLARSLSLLLDGGLASGVLDGHPEAAAAARATAAQLIAVSIGTRDAAYAVTALEEPMTTTAPDAQLERWHRFRTSRNSALASEYGWLTLTSFQWLESRPSAVDLVPGLWSTDGTTAFLTAAAADGLTLVETGEPVNGTIAATLEDEESLMWVQFGGDDGRRVVVELAMRADRYAVRTRDSTSPVFTEFDGVPTFGYRPDLVIQARFRRYDEPVDVPIGTANPLVDGVHRSVGELVFRLPGTDHEFHLQAEEEKLGALTVTFHDETNGDSTDEWRKVSTARPRPDGTVVLDFNRAINYPSAFTPYGTCPMPVKNNSLDARIEAGEKQPTLAD